MLTPEELSEELPQVNLFVLRCWLQIQGMIISGLQRHELHTAVLDCKKNRVQYQQLTDPDYESSLHDIFQQLLDCTCWTEASSLAWNNLNDMDHNKLWIWLRSCGFNVHEQLQYNKLAVFSYFVDRAIVAKRILLMSCKKDGEDVYASLEESENMIELSLGTKSKRRVVEAGDMVLVNPKVRKMTNHFFLEAAVSEEELNDSNAIEVIVLDRQRKVHSFRHVESTYIDQKISIEVELKERGCFQFCIGINEKLPMYSVWFEAGYKNQKAKQSYRQLVRVKTVRCSINLLNNSSVKKQLKECATFCSQLRFG